METEWGYGSDYHRLPVTSVTSGSGIEMRPDLFALTVQIVNVVFVGRPGHGDWLLVDAGMPGTADTIVSAAEERFGSGRPPGAILLTHGHFDHVGAIIELARHWKVPVYAHREELPYLTGRQAYPPPDPTADRGWIAKLSPWFPNEPIDLGSHVKSLPADGSVPLMPDWRWIHTPGHTEGHVSYYQESSRALIAGDAFVTVKQESVYKVLLQEPEISGPPKYFTSDWKLAKQSVLKLEALKPEAAVTGHGRPMEGQELSESLRRLADDFDRIALPDEEKPV
ncbi:MBL fold metallo-hydrolase [Cohnella hongkongensis]|uniref:MBL fold metallo-hydrolase n=1 Tax=Cohnella hongkongensis TaxID=178337 RepID=A0ABV9FK69_9BACL